MIQLHRCNLIPWNPSPVVALASNPQGNLMAVARDNGEIEVWRVAAGSIGWTVDMRIPGKKDAAISSIVWCDATAEQPKGRLLTSSLDGNITEWDLNSLQPKAVIDCYGGSVWSMALKPRKSTTEPESGTDMDCSTVDDDSDSDESSDSDDDDEDVVYGGDQQVAVACDDGCVRLFSVNAEDGVQFKRAFPAVKGRILSVAWSPTGEQIFAGGADGCIRCWNATTFQEVYRINAGEGSSDSNEGLCIWSLLALKDEAGTIVSGDGNGCTQFWDGKHGTLIQSQTRHRADVLTLAVSPSQNSVFAAGVDGQVVLFQKTPESSKESSSLGGSGPWVYVGGRRAHTHDVRALTVAVLPAADEDASSTLKASKKRQRTRHNLSKDQPRWRKPGVAMLISGGNDAQLYTYPADSFMAFYPHAVCPSPQIPPMQLATGDDVPGGKPLLLVQQSTHVDIWRLNYVPEDPIPAADGQAGSGRPLQNGSAGKDAANGVLGKRKMEGMVNGKVSVEEAVREPVMVARIKSSSSEHLSCSSISPNGRFIAISDWSNVRMYELKQPSEGWDAKRGKAKAAIHRIKLPDTVKAAHRVVFSADSAQLIVAAREGGIMIVDVESLSVVHTFAPPCLDFTSASSLSFERLPPSISHMATSLDGKWLAVVDSCGHTCIFDCPAKRLHWRVPSYDSSPPTALLFHSSKPELVVATSSNQIHVLDLVKKDKSAWSKANEGFCPEELLELPCAITGLSMDKDCDDKLLAFSSRYMFHLDLRQPFIRSEGGTMSVSVSKAGRGEENDGRKSAKKQKTVEKVAVLDVAGNGVVSSARRKDFKLKVISFEERTLFMGHIGRKSILLLEQPWQEVVKSLPPPFYYHRYGT